MQLGDTNPVEVLPSPEPHKFLPRLEAHLSQGLFQIQLLAEHQFFLRSTTIIYKYPIKLESGKKEIHISWSIPYESDMHCIELFNKHFFFSF